MSDRFGGLENTREACCGFASTVEVGTATHVSRARVLARRRFDARVRDWGVPYVP